jgi:hypothetical protein
LSNIKEPMTGNYKGVFIFTIVMTIFVFFMAALSGSKGQIGTLIWGYTAWLMYKRNNVQLVSLYKGLLWLVSFAALLMIFLFASYGETLGYSGAGLFFLFLLVFVIDYSLLKFFQREVQNELHPLGAFRAKSSEITSLTLTNEKIWERASIELNGNRREGLWARCFAQSNGDENRARALYLRSRVSEIENELNIKPTSKNYITSIPLINDAKKWWTQKDFFKDINVWDLFWVGLFVAYIAYKLGWIDG